MKSSLIALAFLAAASGTSSGASVFVEAFTDTNFVTFGVLAPIGSSYLAKIGHLPDGTVLSEFPTFADINASWTHAGNIPFASGPAAGSPGYFDGQVSFTDAANLAGKDICVWVTDGGNYNVLLRSTTTDFLADADEPNVNSVVISAATLGQFELEAGIYLAGPNPGGSFTMIPEPSALLLGALGAVGLLRRRR